MYNFNLKNKRPLTQKHEWSIDTIEKYIIPTTTKTNTLVSTKEKKQVQLAQTYARDNKRQISYHKLIVKKLIEDKISNAKFGWALEFCCLWLLIICL